MRQASLVVLLLTVATLAVISSDAQIPARSDPTTLKESECWTCHSDSTNGPPIQVMYLIHGVGETKIPVGEKKLLEVSVQNGWTAELNELTGILDLANAPQVQFASEKEPGFLEYFGEVAQAVEPNERVSLEVFEITPGTTDLIITLEPAASNPARAASNMELHIWPGGKDATRTAPTKIVDDGGPGEAEVFELHGLEAVKELGLGTWTVGAVAKSPTEDPSAVAAQPYHLTVATDFKGTDTTIQFTSVPDILPSDAERPGQLAYLGWMLYVDSLPPAPTTIPVQVILIAHYDHSPTHSSYDDWRYGKTIELELIPDAATNSVTIRADGIAPPPTGGGGFSWGILSEVIGYFSAVLILASIYTGGMFGKTSRRQLNAVFGTAKRRVAFHNALSYGILLMATIHTVIFLIEPAFDWTLGLIWGGISILAMIGLGVTGALQVPMIRKWNYSTWRWSHFYLSIATILFTVIHILLDGVHFSELQDAIGWTNPFHKV